ncbi:pteridine reductase [Legionella fairfieldensis]|uniref:pteridine reductase n=1 Tax=Legionella fairfieldensis TaxID=45064 RepID=UPI00048FF62D|nr:pteridine reductase [Legionella fairfieldensis]
MKQSNKQAMKVALVTGAGRRIGAAIVKLLHQRGFHVAIHCHHSLDEAQNLADQLNQQRSESVRVFQFDLHEAESSPELVGAVFAWKNRLDLLVNNASVFKRTDFTVFNDTDWELLFTVNVKAPFLLSLAARPFLAEYQGTIINLTDIHADSPLKNYAVYCQTKAALVMQTKALAREFAPQIRVNAIAPGAIVWPEQENQLSNQIQQTVIRQTPLRRHGAPEFIAQAVLALAENPFITGQILHVDGGRSI